MFRKVKLNLQYHLVIHEDLPSEEQIDPVRCGVAVASPSPGRAAAAKGTGVHGLKGDVRWVQNGASQFGLYLLEVLLPERKEIQVRKERIFVASCVPVV